jgi:hypothetical protein
MNDVKWIEKCFFFKNSNQHRKPDETWYYPTLEVVTQSSEKKIEAECSSKMLVRMYWPAWHHIEKATIFK